MARIRTGLEGGLVLLLALEASLLLPAYAHRPVKEHLVAVTGQIQADPRNPHLYLKRGELNSQNGDWDAALTDYERVEELDATLKIVDLFRGKTLLEAGRFRQAQSVLDRFLVHHSDHPEGWISRARASVQLGQYPVAVEDYTQGIVHADRVGEPAPELYLERARALMAIGLEQAGKALQGLDQGMKKFGPIATLQLPAIEIELSRQQYGTALTRLDALATRSDPFWWVCRGEILEQAGRNPDAYVAYQQADLALTTHRTGHTNIRATADIKKKVRMALTRLKTIKE